MFNVKRNGASVEITEIPASIPFSVFKCIADETGATETLVCYFKDKTEYEVIIQQTSENMAGMVAWLALEKRDDVITGDAGADVGDADISTIGKRIGVARVKQHMSAQELEEVIGAPEGSVFRWETGKAEPSSSHINALAVVLKCDPEWLLNGDSTNLIQKNELSKVAWLVTELEQEYEKAMKKAANIATCFSVCIRT
ncbi:helix-turn-helix domain-containing protein [Salmonella enterica subsp. enterica serovar Muenchen]|uniref:helix-turn-helix domain-containing protein n=1 Tax=Salmonella enterica TaxID=28901 RepID=UPI001F0FC77D|nr:helix-turn-helix domain-containing protein [Salmonella enterica]MCH5440408.1 helix-turn-helix domain-containing protein [Salmonella enterica subsp. enterica serovar Muenchen]